MTSPSVQRLAGQFLRAAANGNIQSIAIVGIDRRGMIVKGWAGDSAPELMGAAASLSHELTWAHQTADVQPRLLSRSFIAANLQYVRDQKEKAGLYRTIKRGRKQ